MTELQAYRLKPGMPVVVLDHRGGQQIHEVVGVDPYVYGIPPLRKYFRVAVYTRRRGLTEKGKRYPLQTRKAKDILPCPKADPVRANVYADYLEEKGHSLAALCLRQAFPIQD